MRDTGPESLLPTITVDQSAAEPIQIHLCSLLSTAPLLIDVREKLVSAGFSVRLVEHGPNLDEGQDALLMPLFQQANILCICLLHQHGPSRKAMNELGTRLVQLLEEQREGRGITIVLHLNTLALPAALSHLRHFNPFDEEEWQSFLRLLRAYTRAWQLNQQHAIVETSPPEPATRARRMSRGVVAVTLLSLLLAGAILSGRKPNSPTPGAERTLFNTWEAADDGAAGPVISDQPLVQQQVYQISVQGTWSAWPSDWWRRLCGGEPAIQPETASPRRTGGYVGIDSAFIFAMPHQASACKADVRFPRRAIPLFIFEVSLDNGATWAPLFDSTITYSPDHRYHVQVQGQGYPAQFRLTDNPTTSDNYGVLTIEIQRLSP